MCSGLRRPWWHSPSDTSSRPIADPVHGLLKAMRCDVLGCNRRFSLGKSIHHVMSSHDILRYLSTK